MYNLSSFHALGVRTSSNDPTAMRYFRLFYREIWRKTWYKAGMNYLPSRKVRTAYRKARKAGLTEGAKIFLSHGSLLGVIREGRLIRNDKDLDIGVYSESLSLQLMKQLSGRGFKLIRLEGEAGLGMRLEYTYWGLPVDLYVYFKHPDNVQGRTMGLYFRRDPVSSQPVYFYFSFHRVAGAEGAFLGSYFIPENPQTFLNEHYGPEWTTPNSHWSIWFSPMNAEIKNHRVRNADFEEFIDSQLSSADHSKSIAMPSD